VTKQITTIIPEIIRYKRRFLFGKNFRKLTNTVKASERNIASITPNDSESTRGTVKRIATIYGLGSVRMISFR
jgi:hypothetical protein